MDEMFQLEFLIGLITLVVAVVGVGYAIGRWTTRIDEG
jgi:predicted lysophospholipase L1 biosynthesis ABC-type transport system permease subunit